jgi:hypothetical protein
MMPLPSSDAPQMMLTTAPVTPSSATNMQQQQRQQQQVHMQRPVISAIAAPIGGRGASPPARARFVDVELAERPRGSAAMAGAVPSAADTVSTPSSPAEDAAGSISSNIAAPPSPSQRGHVAAESGRLTGARSSSTGRGAGGSRRFMPLASHDDADADTDALELQDDAGSAGGELHGIDLGDLELGEGGQDENDDEDALVL